MALGDDYATVAELKARLRITDDADDARLTEALATASRGIERVTHRQFNRAVSSTARVYRPETRHLVLIDDVHTTTGLVVSVDQDDDGIFETTWTATDYELNPLNGIVDGVPGWPYTRIKALAGAWFPCGERATVQVTAQWGWAEVPAPIKEATLVVAAETFKLADAPFGVAGFGEWGMVRVRQNPLAMAMIAPYRRSTVLVA